MRTLPPESGLVSNGAKAELPSSDRVPTGTVFLCIIVFLPANAPGLGLLLAQDPFEFDTIEVRKGKMVESWQLRSCLSTSFPTSVHCRGLEIAKHSIRGFIASLLAI